MADLQSFDPSYLSEIIDAIVDDGVVTSAITTETAQEGILQRRVTLTLGDALLFQHLPVVLRSKVPQDVASAIIADLRHAMIPDAAPMSMAYVHTAVKHCHTCPKATSSPSLPYGNVENPDVIFVHPTPRMERDVEAINTLLAELDIDRSTVLHTSLTRCSFEEVSTTEVENCSPFLLTEIETLRPKVTVLLGALTAQAILGDIKVTQVRGNVFWLGPWPFLAMHSPAYAAKQESALSQLKDDLNLMKTFCYGSNGTDRS